MHERRNPFPEPTVARLVPIAILNPFFVTSYVPPAPILTFHIPNTSISISFLQLLTFDVDSDSVLLTVTKVIKHHKDLSDVDTKTFAISEKEEIDFLINKTFKPIPMKQFPDNVELQPLKLVLAEKTNNFDEEKNGHHSRIVSAFHNISFATTFMIMPLPSF